MTYFIFFPALLVDNLAHAHLGNLDPTGMLGALLIALIVQAALVYALRPLMNVDGPAFTSVFQGAVRFNTFVGLGAVTALEGGTGVTRSEEHTSELQSLMRISYAVFCLKKKKKY